MSVQFQNAVEWANPGEVVLWTNPPKDPFVPLQMHKECILMVTKMVKWDGHDTSLVYRLWS